MDISVQQQGAVAVVQCVGSLDASTVAQFKTVLQAVVADGVHRIVIDGAALTFIDSMGLGALISLQRRTRRHQGAVHLAALCPDVQAIMEMTRLDRVFVVCPTTDEACQRFVRDASPRT